MTSAGSGVRLMELVAALSLATDLGLGLPQEHVLRQTVLARRIACAAGLPADAQSAVSYVSLLAWVGCISDSHEMSTWFGDDLQLRADSYEVDMAGLPMMRFMMPKVGATEPPLRRLTVIGRFLTTGRREAGAALLTHCQTTGDIAGRLGLGEPVREALAQVFERWDGQGVPAGLRGDQVLAVTRVVHLADDLEVLHRTRGTEAALAMLQQRRGTQFDPALVDLCCQQADELFDGLDHLDVWEEVLQGLDEPELTEDELTTALEAVADYADLKSPSWMGHSRGVASLARAAGAELRLPEPDLLLLYRAGLVHDLGVTGVSSLVWDQPRALGVADRERVRTHPYLTERVLARPAALARVGALAALHHERLDGSGYPRGLRADALPKPARLLAVADVMQALGEARPHRPALDPVQRTEVLRAEVAAGRLDGEAVNAVLTASGHRVRRRPALPAGLTAREVEVLVMVASGLPNKQVAQRLNVSARTVGSHLEHAYAKIGVSTRGAAAMYVMRHGLVAQP